MSYSYFIIYYTYTRTQGKQGRVKACFRAHTYCTLALDWEAIVDTHSPRVYAGTVAVATMEGELIHSQSVAPFVKTRTQKFLIEIGTLEAFIWNKKYLSKS